MTFLVVYRVDGSVCSEVGAPGKSWRASLASTIESRPTTRIAMASLGHAATHAGASPCARRSLHMSHLRTMPLFLLYFGASYGHMSVQYWQPKHWSSRCLTMPVRGSFS